MDSIRFSVDVVVVVAPASAVVVVAAFAENDDDGDVFKRRHQAVPRQMLSLIETTNVSNRRSIFHPNIRDPEDLVKSHHQREST